MAMIMDRGEIKTKTRPSRVELFGFYYLGFYPNGNYKFPNVRHVAAWYRVSHDAVQRWLDEYDMPPKRILLKQYNLAAEQVDLQLEAPGLAIHEIHARIEKIMAECDESLGGRRPWEDVD